MIELARWRWSGSDVHEYLSGQISAPVPLAGGRFALLLDPRGVIVSWLWLDAFGDDVIVSAPAALAENVEQRLRRFRIRVAATDERVVDEQWDDDQVLCVSAPTADVLGKGLLASGLERRFFDASVVLNRGCYPGQEMVERADSRGVVAPLVHRHGQGDTGAVQAWLDANGGGDVVNSFVSGDLYVVTRRSVELASCPAWSAIT